MAEIIDHQKVQELKSKEFSKPLVSHMFTVDPSAHVFGGKIYIYPSHDSSLSNGVTHFRSVKMSELMNNEGGSIQTIDAYLKKFKI